MLCMYAYATPICSSEQCLRNTYPCLGFPPIRKRNKEGEFKAFPAPVSTCFSISNNTISAEHAQTPLSFSLSPGSSGILGHESCFPSNVTSREDLLRGEDLVFTSHGFPANVCVYPSMYLCVSPAHQPNCKKEAGLATPNAPPPRPVTIFSIAHAYTCAVQMTFLWMVPHGKKV